MPTFCRHNRFIERCPICSRTLPGNEPAPAAAHRARSASSATGRRGTGSAPRRTQGEGLRVRREGRAAEDGYSCELVPGLRASADAERLAREIAFSGARLAALAADPPGAYGRAFEAAAEGRLEEASWSCFLLAYLSPAEGAEPFGGVDRLLAAAPLPAAVGPDAEEILETAPLGPRSSHRPGSGTRTLRAYAQWAQRAGGDGGQAAAFTGDPGWDSRRRFARLYERLALPGLSRGGRYELLVTLGRLGLYELAPDSLQLAAPRGGAGEDATALAAKRVFGIGDALLLDRRAGTLAAAAGVPLEALDLALFNWSRTVPEERATFGYRPTGEPDASAVAATLGLEA
jgi:hypothetical protein